jgi:hypothetical protein
MYADDMVLGSPNKEELQRAFSALVEWAGNNSLKINWAKTQQMVFRKGGRTAATLLITSSSTVRDYV